MAAHHAMLCGDEIKSAVVDLGTSVCRFGTAGQDVPRHTFRSRVGELSSSGAQKRITGDVHLRHLSNDTEIRRPVFGTDDIELLLKYGVEDSMRLQLTDTPLMLSHNALLGGWCSTNKELQSNKEKVLQLCLEGAGTPALYLANSSMLSAFSMGRTNSLVLDIGSCGTRISPVVDGYELRRSSVFTSRGGDLLDSLLVDEVQRRSGGAIRPWFDCAKTGLKPVPVTQSFRAFHVGEVVQDVKQWMCFVPHAPIVIPGDVLDPVMICRLREEELSRRLLHFPPPYELPDGTLVHSGESICTVPERVFFPYLNADGSPSSHGAAAGASTKKRTRELLETTFPESALGATTVGSSSEEGSAVSSGSTYHTDTLMNKLGGRADQESLSDLVYACVAHADPDVRRELLSNIQLVGGGALIQGLSNRLSHELAGVVPSHMKVKQVPGLPVERQNAAWIGGSILSICGSFQQLWLTKQEYDEQGPIRAALRFDH